MAINLLASNGGGTDLGPTAIIVDSTVAADGNGRYSTFSAAYTAASAGDTIICLDDATFSENPTFNKSNINVWCPNTTINGNVTIQQGRDFIFGTINSLNATAPLRVINSSVRSVTVHGELRNYSTAIDCVLISNPGSTRFEFRGRVDTGSSAAIRVTGASSTPPRASTSDGLASSLAPPKPGAAPQPGSVPPLFN